jgi:hypothetical protein
MQTPWVIRYAQRTERMKNSAIRELLKFTEKPLEGYLHRMFSRWKNLKLPVIMC